MIKVRTKGLLFDMDGVLISSLGSVERSWQTWAERHGLDVRETIKTAHGMRAIETVRTLKPDSDHEAELKVIEDLEVGDNEGLEVLEGVSGIAFTMFTSKDVVRHPLVQRIVQAYESRANKEPDA